MGSADDRAFDGGLRSQVKPTFMAPALGMSAFGGLLSPTFAAVVAALHALAVGSALYTAHLVDEYVDAHVRREEPPAVNRRTVERAIVGASVGCLAFAGALVVGGRWAAAASAVVLWLLAVLHAPVLDRNTAAVTADYPVGIAVALGGGYLAQQSALPAGVVGIAAVFVPTLAGVKVSVDRLDREFDRTIDKRTVPVVLGDRRSRWVSAGLFLLAAALVGLLVAGSLLTGAALLAVPALVGGAVVGHDDDPARAVARQMLLVYPLAAVLFVSRCLATGCVVAAAVSAFP